MLNRPPRGDHQDDEPIFGMHVGDLGVIAIAALFTIAWILMVVLPSPFAKMDQMKAAAAKAERQKEIQKSVDTGEVSVGIPPAQKH